ncbi:MAG TPA: hypothetical protein VFR01_08005, partial [Geobacterales bacterium]|nr:hypothetical protein [Geobacterales bacterium]
MALHLPLHAASLTLSSSGNGVYTLIGSGLNGIQAVDLDVSYDATDLNSPRFSSAGAATVTVIGNETTTGRLKLVAMSFTTSPLPSDGPLATITFNRKGEGGGRILSTTASGALLNGPLTPISVSIVNPTPSTANIPATSSVGKSSAGVTISTTTPLQGNPSTPITPTNSGSTSPPVPERTSGMGAMALPVGGTHRLPPTASRGVTAPSTPGGKEARSVQSSGSGDAVGGKQGQPPAPTRLVPLKSVLERFKEYDGERSMAIFRSFIAASGTVSQEPYPALSDGQGVVRLKIPGDATAPAPAFAVKGARIVGMKRIDRGGWQVEVLPLKGVTAASVTILGREALSEYPLVVAPPA